MLSDAPLIATIPARDLERAKRFYQDTLGLTLVSESSEDVQFSSGGMRLDLYPTRSQDPPATHTLAGWDVADLDAEMADLRDRGVTFEEYDLPGLKTVNGVAEAEGFRGAWFKDSEGNILAVTQEIAQ